MFSSSDGWCRVHAELSSEFWERGRIFLLSPVCRLPSSEQRGDGDHERSGEAEAGGGAAVEQCRGQGEPGVRGERGAAGAGGGLETPGETPR